MKINLSIKKFQSLIETSEIDSSEFQTYLRLEKMECLYMLNKWEPLVEEIQTCPAHQSNFVKNPSETLLKTLKGMSSTERYIVFNLVFIISMEC